MIIILDVKFGNLHSIKNALNKINAESNISNDINDLDKAKKIILPGVGSFDNYINSIENLGLLDLLNDKVLNKKVPVLGICAGMQIMTNGSEEGKNPGLSWIDGFTIKFNSTTSIKIPHIGWNSVNYNYNKFKDKINLKYYFCHSYYVNLKNKNYEIASTSYGRKFVSILKKDNIYGCQFHPEKSHIQGLNF